MGSPFFVRESAVFYRWIFRWIFKVDIHLGDNWIFKTGFWRGAIERGKIPFFFAITPKNVPIDTP